MGKKATRLHSMWVAGILIGACSGDGADSDTASHRQPLVDPASGRVEEIPSTERPRLALVAPELDGDRAAASRRHTDRVARVGVRTVRRHGRTAREVALSSLGRAELAAHFDDGRIAADRPRGALVAGAIAEARATAATGDRPPTSSQEAALLALEAGAMTDVRVDWDQLRGSPRRIAGALDVVRGVAPEIVGDDWQRSAWTTLGAALGADSDDTLVLVTTRELPDDLMEVTYRRDRGGVPMPENLVHVHVTQTAHPAGSGLVLRVEAQWDTDVASGTPPVDALGEADAILLAEDALGVRMSPTTSHTELSWRCFSEVASGARCRPVWTVRYLPDTAVDLGDPTRGTEPDTARLDARTGAVLLIERSARDYTGHVSQTTNYPFDTADVQRDMRFAEMRQWATLAWIYSNTDSDGEYDWSPPGSPAQIGLHSRGQPITELHHADPAKCGQLLPDYQWMNFDLSAGASIVVSPNATTHARSDWLLFHYLQYATEMFSTEFANVAEPPSIVRFDAGPGGGGVWIGCDPSAEMGVLAVGAGDDTTASSGVLRDVFWEEIHHATGVRRPPVPAAAIPSCSRATRSAVGGTTPTGVRLGAS